MESEPLPVGTLWSIALLLALAATTARPKAVDPKHCGPDDPGHHGQTFHHIIFREQKMLL